ncbi:MAG: amino acid ABC transporter substrate-binding protein [Bauldia sp.]|nr:amino acid ABC transporter substrate-binding protein [Bauldia sp.]
MKSWRLIAAAAVAALFMAEPTFAQPRTIHAVAGLTNAPWSYRTPEGTQTGMVVELCNAIAEDNGWTMNYTAMALPEFFPTIAAGDGDILCSVFSYTEERAAQATFTPPFFEASDGLAVAASDATAYRNWDDIKNLPVGVPVATIFQTAAVQRGIFSDLRPFDTNQAGLEALMRGEIRAFISLEPSLKYLLAQGYPGLRVVETMEPNIRIPYNFMVRKGDPALLAAVNASLAKLWADGTLREIMTRWGL